MTLKSGADGDTGGCSALLAVARQHGRAFLAERLAALETTSEAISPSAAELVGILETLRRRIAAARIALDDDDGFAVAWLVMQCEQLAATFNSEQLRPTLKGVANTNSGRKVSHEVQRENYEELNRWRDAEIRRLDAESPLLKSKSSRAKRIKPELDKWVVKYNAKVDADLKVKTLGVDSIRKMLANRR